MDRAVVAEQMQNTLKRLGFEEGANRFLKIDLPFLYGPIGEGGGVEMSNEVWLRSQRAQRWS